MSSINLERIREATMGDEEFMAELIEVFLDDSPGQLDLLRRAVAERDAAAAASSAHRLKGSSGQVGAESLSELCKKLEQESRASNGQDLEALMAKVDQEFQRVRDELSAVRAGL